MRIQGVRLALVAVFAALLARVAIAASTTEVYVHLSYVNRSVGGATCRLRSPLAHAQGLSDREGVARFTAVSPGTYSVECEAAGYDAARSEIVVHDDAAELHVEIGLRLREIGHVTAHEPATTTSRIVSRGSPLGKISQNLYDAMNGLGGANVMTDASGSLVGVSLEGRDPRLTQYSFDGTRIPEPGALRAFDPDLLQSVDVDNAKSEIDFYTLAPTTFPEYTLRKMIGGFGADSTQLGLRGSVGSIGYVVQGTFRAQRSALDDATYLDTSGLTYRHVGALHADGLLSKVSVPVGKTFTLTTESLIRGTTSLPIDTYFAGPLPSGAGPGNLTTSSSALAKAELEGDVGRWHVQVNATSIRLKQQLDYHNRIVANTPLPFETKQQFRLNIFDTSLIDFIAEGKTLNLNFALSRGTSDLRTTNGAFGASYAGEQQLYRPDERFGVLYVARPTSQSQQSIGLTAESRGMGRTTAYLEANASKGSGGRRIFATLGFGGRAVPAGELRSFDDPGAAQYDCNGDAIRARAPNDTATNVRERHVRAGGLLQGRSGSLSVQAYDTFDAGLTVSNADTPLSAYSPSSLPSNFVDMLLKGYALYGGCGTPHAAPSIYLQRDVGGLNVEYRGVEITGSTKISRSLTLQASLNAHLATLKSRSAALVGDTSPYIVGRQLPGVEPLDASFTADYALRDRRTELIANAVYKPRFNGNELPAYWLVTIGGTRRLSPTSTLTFVAANATHSYVDLFASPRYAVPLPTAGGGQLLLPASPLVQPQLYLIFNTRIAHER